MPSNTITPLKEVMICKRCKKILEYFELAHDSHYQCPRCKMVRFMDNEGTLQMEKAHIKEVLVTLSDTNDKLR